MSEAILDSLLAKFSGKVLSQDDKLADLLVQPDPVGVGDIVRFDHLRGRWLVWNGVRWRPDLTRTIYDMVRRQVGTWMSSDALNGEDRKSILGLFNVSKKESVLKSLSARQEIAMSGNEWDVDGYLVGFENGIIDLRAGEFFAEPDPTMMVSKSVGCDWDPAAQCPVFDAFLDDIMGGDAELVAYLRRLIGYSLIGTQAEQKFWMWVGRGANGKGVLARTLDEVFGDYSETPADTMYMRTKYGASKSDAARPDLMRLQSIRFTYMSEPPGNQFNEEMLKAHTGEDTIIARDLYAKAGQFAQFRPTHKIVFLTNDPPKTDDVGVSMARRVRVVRFEKDYEPRPDLVLPDGQRIKSNVLEDILKSERQGILNLAIREAIAWTQDAMPEPALVTQWSKEYIEENDPLAEFIRDRCEVSRGLTGSASALWSSYEDWSAQRDQDAMSQTGFGLAMTRKFKKVKRNTGAVYLGIRAKNAAELADEE